MKKLAYFIPTCALGAIYLFLLFVVGGWNEPMEWLGAAAYIAPLFLSDLLLSKGKWFGGIPGAVLGGYFILSYLQQPWPVSSPLNWQVGAVLLAYYLSFAVLNGIKAAKTKKQGQ